MSQNGKGSLPRPKSVSVLTFDENWKRTFMDADEDGIPHDAEKVSPPLRVTPLHFPPMPKFLKQPWVKDDE